mmetsp:Transcript_19000/g.40889  ORF Transcript_19000/g.40889 Transcript_19000/m.40889 type:complete len:185 (+) Transcript_19000:187-741(+)
MPADVETSSSSSSNRPTTTMPSNPYQGQGTLLPPDHIVHKLKRLLYIGGSGFVLHKFHFHTALVKSPKILHSWFQLGLACTIAILMVKAYVETFEVKLRKKEVNYKNYPQTTHTIIGLILASTVAFNCALWPHYGWNTPILMGTCFFGIILQFMLLVPTYVQNVVGLIVFTFVLQEYSGVSMLY